MTCLDFTCGNFLHGQPYLKGRDCPRCWNGAHRLGMSITGRATPTTKRTTSKKIGNGSVARVLPCLHLGAKSKPNCGCTDCNCNAGLGVVQHLRECQTCDKYESKQSAVERKSHATDDARYAELLREQLTRHHAYPDTHHGRGIVTVAGGARYFTCAYVLLSLLRRHGCTLPVEVWCLDEGEIDGRMRELLLAFGGVTIVNAAMVADMLPPDERPKRLQGWECKTLAIQHSVFREVLFLDSDQLPARDPTYLFDLPEFAEHGAVFWPDYEPEGWRVTERAFRVAGLDVPGKRRKPDWYNPTDYDAWETGQILIDKSRHWTGLKLWQWFGDHAEYWYQGCVTGKGRDLVYGDKDTAYLAWHTLRIPFALAPAAGWLGTVNVSGCFVQHDMSGQVVFHHRVQPPSKFNLHGSNPPIPGCEVWPWVADALADLRAKWSGRPYDSYGEPPNAVASVAVGEWWLCRGEQPAQAITLRPDRTASGVKGITHWTLRADHRGTVLVLSSGMAGVHMLGEDRYGSWCNHGTETFLVPAPPKGISLPRTRHDAVIAHSILRQNEYRYPEQFPPGSVVLDLGSHCGLSVRAALDRGAGHVVAVEPAPGNLEHLRRNYGKDSRVTILPVAAWLYDGTVRLAPGEVPCPATASSSGWTISGLGALEVPCMAYADLIATAAALSESGRIAMLKMDIEGAEWSIMPGADLSAVDAVALEYHGAGRPAEDTPERLAAMLGSGWTVEVFPHGTQPRLGIVTARKVSDCRDNSP
jgi:FkbM family methyltransferase